MPTIVIHKNPVDPSANELVIVDSGRRIHDHIVRLYPTPNFGGIPTELYLNHVIEGDELEPNDTEQILLDSDILHIVHRPQGTEAALVLAIVSFVIGIASVLLLPDPPNLQIAADNNSKNSPNNNVQGQRNLARLRQAIPELFGSGVSFPDLLATPYFLYEDNMKIVRQLFCVGVGNYDISNIKIGDSPIFQNQRAEVTIYNPSSPPTDIKMPTTIYGVSGQNIEPSVSSDISISYDLQFISGATSTVIIGSASAEADLDIKAGVGLNISGTVSNDGDVTVLSSVADFSLQRTTITVSQVVVDETVNGALSPQSVIASVVHNANLTVDVLLSTSQIAILGTPTIGDVLFFPDHNISSQISNISGPGPGGVFAFRLVSSVPAGFTGVISATFLSYIGWFNSSLESDQLIFNLQAPRGLFLGTGGGVSISIDLQYQKIDADGASVDSPISNIVSLSGSSQTPISVSHTYDVDLSRYRVRVRRITPVISGSNGQLIRWENCLALSDYPSNMFGDVTTISLDISSGTFGAPSQEDRFNIDYVRRLGTWTESDGYNTTRLPTTKFADAILYILHERGDVPLSNIDLSGLYEIQDNLRDQQLGEFTYSFDDSSSSLGQSVQSVANAARCLVYRDGQIWRFTRDELKPRSALFNRRNIAASGSQKINMLTNKPGDFNGVVIEYRNPVTNKPKEIAIAINSATQSFDVGVYSDRPSRIPLIGVRNDAQALNRAHYEVRRLVYQKNTVEDRVLSDGHLVNIGDHVGWADIYDTDVFEGEVLAIDGSVFTTSERLDFEDGQTYIGSISNNDGSVTASTEITIAGDFKFSADFSSANPLIANNDTIQAGSRYLITLQNDEQLQSFSIVQKAPDEDGSVTLRMAEYDNRIFEMD